MSILIIVLLRRCQQYKPWRRQCHPDSAISRCVISHIKIILMIVMYVSHTANKQTDSKSDSQSWMSIVMDLKHSVETPCTQSIIYRPSMEYQDSRTTSDTPLSQLNHSLIHDLWLKDQWISRTRR